MEEKVPKARCSENASNNCAKSIYKSLCLSEFKKSACSHVCSCIFKCSLIIVFKRSPKFTMFDPFFGILDIIFFFGKDQNLLDPKIS